MTQSARIVGIPGAGKTTRGMDLIRKLRAAGFHLQQIGYCSMTRAARGEASRRAAETFDVDQKELERTGWFRTVHSCVMRLLGVQKGELVNGDRAWFTANLGEHVESENLENADGWSEQFRSRSGLAVALNLWDVARQRLVSLQDVIDEAQATSGARLRYDGIADIVRTYESCKDRDGRSDFTDFILRYGGYRMTEHGAETITPQGEASPVRIWFFDEAQDNSPAIDAACKRLAEGAVYLYLMGDPLQEIYRWCGASAAKFMNWPVVKSEYLTKSWRCSANVLTAATRLIHRNHEYACDLAEMTLEPAGPGGEVRADQDGNLCNLVDPHTSTLIMARTNKRADTLARQLEDAGIPFKCTKSGRRYPKLTSSKLCNAFDDLQQGLAIDGEAWHRIVDVLPLELMERGTRTRFKAKEYRERFEAITLADVAGDPILGAGETVADVISSGQWKELAGEDSLALACRQKYGELAETPKVIVATVHSSKGMEADHVFLDTEITKPIMMSMNQSDDGRDEERKVWYVGMTRAKSRLILLESSSGKNYEEVYDVVG